MSGQAGTPPEELRARIRRGINGSIVKRCSSQCWQTGDCDGSCSDSPSIIERDEALAAVDALLAELEATKSVRDEALRIVTMLQATEATKLAEVVRQRDALAEALDVLLEWAKYADLQIHGEWGTGKYVEAEEITAAGAALSLTKEQEDE